MADLLGCTYWTYECQKKAVKSCAGLEAFDQFNLLCLPQICDGDEAISILSICDMWAFPYQQPWVFLLKMIILGCEMGVPPCKETPMYRMGWKHRHRIHFLLMDHLGEKDAKLTGGGSP